MAQITNISSQISKPSNCQIKIKQIRYIGSSQKQFSRQHNYITHIHTTPKTRNFLIFFYYLTIISRERALKYLFSNYLLLLYLFFALCFLYFLILLCYTFSFLSLRSGVSGMALFSALSSHDNTKKNSVYTMSTKNEVLKICSLTKLHNFKVIFFLYYHG